MRARLLRRALVLLLGAAPAAAAQHPLVGLPLDDPAYAQLDGLVSLGCGAARISAFRPFMVKDIQAALRAAAAEPACRGRVLDALTSRFLEPVAAQDSARADSSRLRFGAAATLRATGQHGGTFYPLWRDIRPVSQGDPAAVGLARLRLTWNGGPNVVFVSEAYGETQRRNDPTVRASAFRSTSGVIDFSDAYASGKLGPVVLSIGRAREAWIGEGTESLVLSANGPALDRITLTAQWPKFEFKALVASLNDVVLTPQLDSLSDSTTPQRFHRMLIAHALTYRPSRQVEITIGETGLIPSRGGGVNLAYANPLMIYQVTQNDSARATDPASNVNLTAFGSIRANVGRASLQGDLLIDDIQIDAKDRARYPNLFGWMLQGTYALPLPMPTSIGAQYRRVGAFTYLETFYTDTWQQYDQPIGSELGPDADMGRAFAEIWPRGKLRVIGGLARWRRGANRIDQRPPANREGHAGALFPYTTAARPAVQAAWMGDLTVEWLDPVLPVSLQVDGASVENPNNQPGPTETLARVQLSVSYRWRYP